MADTEFLTKPATNGESKVGSLSVRAFVTLMLVGSVCAVGVMAAAFEFKQQGQIMVIEPLATLAGIAVGYYFGQKNSQKT